MAQELLYEMSDLGVCNMDYRILCIDDDSDFLTMLKCELSDNYDFRSVNNLRDGLSIIQKEVVDLVLLDINLGDENGLEGLRKIKNLNSSVDVAMVTGMKDPKTIIASIRAGASDYICKPFEKDELIAIVEKLRGVRQIRNRHDALVADLNAAGMTKMLGVSRALRDLLGKAECVKGHSANILIEGESGTGKELLARHIHGLEENPKRPFIAVNCAAIPETMIESELFGHEKGAFTNAMFRKLGKFELADGGDIFLDEISTLRTELQAKILRALQEKEISRLGSTNTIQINFRVIAATNENLEKMVDENKFRIDLYHRLRVIKLEIPPLRERLEDLPLLVDHFLEKYSKFGNKKNISPEAIEALECYNWPGNVRELENLIHNLVIMSPRGTIDVGDLPDWTTSRNQLVTTYMDCKNITAKNLKEFIRQAERLHIEKILRMAEGNKSKAAEILDVSRTTLHTRLKELEIE